MEDKKRDRKCEYSRGLACLICGKALQNANKSDYCKDHMPKRFLANDFMW